jgi:hypothetical protein
VSFAALACVAGVLAVSAPAAASSFRCSRAEPNRGPSLNWEARRVEWGLSPVLPDSIDGDTSEAVAEIRRAFQTWTDVECSDLVLDFQGVDGGYEPGFNPSGLNENVVGYRDRWPHDPDAIALTFTAFRVSSGELLDADIELNGEGFDFVLADEGCAEAVDLRNVMTHEVGHLLGLDHPPRTPRNVETTMFGNAPLCETTKRTLAEGDIEGLCTIYPRGQPTEQCFAPGTLGFEVVGSDDGFEGGCRAAPLDVGGALFSVVLAAGALRRKRDEP